MLFIDLLFRKIAKTLPIPPTIREIGPDRAPNALRNRPPKWKEGSLSFLVHVGLNPAVGHLGFAISCVVHARKESRRQRRTPHRRRGQPCGSFSLFSNGSDLTAEKASETVAGVLNFYVIIN